MSDELVSQILDRVPGERPGPRSITVDSGTEFQFRALEDWPIAVACSSTSFDRGNPWKMLLLNRLRGAYAMSD
jgi:hypothetical protein